MLPLLDVGRRYHVWRMADQIGTIFLVTMVLGGLLMEMLFTLLGLIPHASHDIRANMTHLSLNYTFWMNLMFGALTLVLIVLAQHHPPMHHNRNDMHGGEERP